MLDPDFALRQAEKELLAVSPPLLRDSLALMLIDCKVRRDSLATCLTFARTLSSPDARNAARTSLVYAYSLSGKSRTATTIRDCLERSDHFSLHLSTLCSALCSAGHPFQALRIAQSATPPQDGHLALLGIGNALLTTRWHRLGRRVVTSTLASIGPLNLFKPTTTAQFDVLDSLLAVGQDQSALQFLESFPSENDRHIGYARLAVHFARSGKHMEALSLCSGIASPRSRMRAYLQLADLFRDTHSALFDDATHRAQKALSSITTKRDRVEGILAYASLSCDDPTRRGELIYLLEEAYQSLQFLGGDDVGTGNIIASIAETASEVIGVDRAIEMIQSISNAQARNFAWGDVAVKLARLDRCEEAITAADLTQPDWLQAVAIIEIASALVEFDRLKEAVRLVKHEPAGHRRCAAWIGIAEVLPRVSPALPTGLREAG